MVVYMHFLEKNTLKITNKSWGISGYIRLWLYIMYVCMYV